jgi:hypothetical protein
MSFKVMIDEGKGDNVGTTHPGHACHYPLQPSLDYAGSENIPST